MAEWLHLSWVEFLAILAMCAATIQHVYWDGFSLKTDRCLPGHEPCWMPRLGASL